MPIATTLDEVRLLIGDTDVSNALLKDEEIQYFLTERADNVLHAAADACLALAAKFSRYYDFETDGQKFARSTMAKEYRLQAREFRSQAGGVVSVVTTRVDGYSQDIDSEAVDSVATNPRRKFYGTTDNPF